MKQKLYGVTVGNRYCGLTRWICFNPTQVKEILRHFENAYKVEIWEINKNPISVANFQYTGVGESEALKSYWK